MMVYDKKRTFRYNSLCNSEALLLLVKSGVHSLYRTFVVRRLDSFHDKSADMLI